VRSGSKCRCSVQPGITLDIQFEVSVVAGAPASWSVGIIERFHTTTAPAGAGRQQEGDLSMVPCGKPFTLEIEALDVNHNRCAANPKHSLHPAGVAFPTVRPLPIIWSLLGNQTQLVIWGWTVLQLL
jgi:hypothetical protein